MRERKEGELTYQTPATGICEDGKDWMMKRNKGDMPITRYWYERIGICVGEKDLKLKGNEKDLKCRLNAIGIRENDEEGKVKDMSDLKYRMTTSGISRAMKKGW